MYMYFVFLSGHCMFSDLSVNTFLFKFNVDIYRYQ